MKPLRILVVDDDHDFAEALKGMLLYQRHEVEIAFSGEEAIRIVRQQDFDITFMDARMPGMSGVETFREILKMKPNANVVMITAHGGPSVEEASVEGALQVLHKPFVPAELFRILASLTGHDSARRG